MGRKKDSGVAKLRLAFLDCISGISGDMLLGAFLDLGWQKQRLLRLPSMLDLESVRIQIKDTKRSQLRAVKVDIRTRRTQPLRDLEALGMVLDSSSLPPRVCSRAFSVLERIAEAEARIHGCSRQEVHFHEIGAADTIVDIVGTLLAVEDLSIDKIFCSPLPLGRGLISSQHGTLPLPAPAVLELLKGVPVYAAREDAELVTPTGAALAVELASGFGSIPGMRILQTGYGAGSHRLNSMPNVMRIIIGQAPGEREAHLETICEIRTVIDDMSPEQLGGLFDVFLQQGALDMWITPVHMKKNRPGFELAVLCLQEREKDLAELIFCHTSTSGLRLQHKRRLVLHRKKVSIQTRWGAVDAKVIIRPGGLQEVTPEFDSCRHIAQKFKIPLRVVYSEIMKAGDQWEED